MPVNISKVSASDLYPEGTFRARIIRADVRPDPKKSGKDVGSDFEIVGEFNDEGKQKYAVLNVGFRFTEHPSNYAPSPITGEVVPLVGRTLFEGFSFHPSFRHNVRRLFDNVGVKDSDDTDDLLERELDIVLKNEPSRNDPDQKETRVKRTAVAKG